MIRPRRRTSILAFSLAALAGGCAGAASVRGDPGADEREIYRLLIEDQEAGRYGGALLVLEDSLTLLRRDQIREALANPDNGLTPSDLAAIDDLLEVGRSAPRVPLDLGTRRPYEVGDSASSAESRDVLYVSAFGWGPARDHVVVHVDYFCEGCGWGGLTFFSRGSGGWRIESKRWMWQS
jgi:hypothetical protein